MTDISLYTINRYIRSLADEWAAADELDRPGLMEDIIQILTTELGAGVTPLTREYIRSLAGEEFAGKESDFHAYDYNGAEQGKTYLTVAGRDLDGNTISIPLILRVQYTSKREKKHGKANPFPDFARSFEHAWNSVASLLQKLNADLYISQEFFSQFDYSITDRHGRQPEFHLHGESIELPFALCIFSLIVKRDLPSGICSTGRLDGADIRTVEQVKEKFSSAVLEFDEIEKVLIPSSAPAGSAQGLPEHVTAIYTSTLEEAVFECFKDYKQIARSIAMPGLVTYDVREIEVITPDRVISGTEVQFNVAEGDFLNADYLNAINIDDMAKRLNSHQVIVFSNARASWHIGYLCSKFVNSCSNVVVYDPKISLPEAPRAGIVTTQRQHAPLKLGTTVPYRYTT